MLHRDYLMDIISEFIDAIRRSVDRAKEKKDPRGAATMLEAAVSEATDIDGETLLSLAPESIATILQVSGVDPRVTEYLSRSMLLESTYLAEAGDAQLSEIRAQQAYAIARAYGHDLSAESITDEALEEFMADDQNR